ncbi:hypothetical protein Tco_1129228 [Tanacetum coccineum]
MDDDLFTYQVGTPELCNTPRVNGQLENLDNVNLDVYESKVCYDECEKIYDEVIIFIDKRLVSNKRLFKYYMEIKKRKEVYGLDANMEYDPSNDDLAEWLALKFCNHITIDWYTKNALWIYWTRGDDEVVLTKDELSDLKEESDDGTKIAKIFRIETDLFCNTPKMGRNGIMSGSVTS